ncbi:hypothetical protein AB6M97_05045 [Streptococcus hillyeri]|uniref:Uncharacterized protein n=1 Tax=Streptococcus hillyeri TaxID=2282420 RepID=A0A3L9DZW2_9STRE|nr:hypothetical protein [Streptococcus hillyeri]RLY05377.1 hypothetical protein EAF07_01380 [Streptococcus hillyeri]
MARKKLIEDEVLITILEDYLIEECQANYKLFKLPRFGDYLRNNGYPAVADTTLRRNTVFREYIETLKHKYEDEGVLAVLTYKTLDVDNFLRIHSSLPALKQGLVKLNDHHKRITEAAIEFKKEVEVLKKEKSSLQDQLEIMKQELSDNKEKLIADKRLEKENQKLRNLIKSSVYPEEIANELLKADGLLKLDSDVIQVSYLQNEILTADSEINFHQKDTSQTSSKQSKVVNIKNLLDSKTKY